MNCEEALPANSPSRWTLKTIRHNSLLDVIKILSYRVLLTIGKRYSRRAKDEKKENFKGHINYTQGTNLRSNQVCRVVYIQSEGGGVQYSNLGYIYNVMILRIVLVYQKFLCNRPRFSGFQEVYSLVCFELIFI